MVSTETRNHVWNQLLDIARLSRYYGRLSSRMTLRNNLRAGTLALAATSAVASLLNILPAAVEVAANVAIAGLACWMMGNHAQKLAVVRGVSERCRELESETRSLWLNLDRLDDAHARTKWEHLDREINWVTSKPESSGVRNDDALNEACEAEAYRAIGQEYAAPSLTSRAVAASATG